MKLWTKSLLILSSLCSVHAMASVNVKVDDSIELLAYNGEEVGIRVIPLKELDLDNGLNQVVVRVSKLVKDNSGQFQKFNSKVSIITFEAHDQSVNITLPQDIATVKQSEAYNKQPSLSIESDKALKQQQELLPKAGGFTRDYEKEIKRYNSKRNIVIAAKTIATPFSTVGEASTPVNTVTESELSDNLGVLKREFSGLTEQQKKEFLKWAISQ